MAMHLESNEIKELPVLPYSEVRAKLRSGDLLFTSGDYLVSKAIQKVTGSPWSHVGIVFRLDSIDRMLLLESVEDMGVRFAPLFKYLKWLVLCEDISLGSPLRRVSREGSAILANRDSTLRLE